MTHPLEALEGLQVGFLGAGNMGGAIAHGLIKSGGMDGDRVWLYAPTRHKVEALASSMGARVAQDPAALLDVSDVVVLGCKPQIAQDVLAGLDWPDKPMTMISVAAGLKQAWLEARVPANVKVVRTMPNVASQVGAGVTGVLRCDPVQMAQTEAVFGCSGEVVVLDKESLFEALTAMSGSGPAYLFVLMEAMADAGVKLGLPRKTAIHLAIHTVRGAGELALHSDAHFGELKDRVSSPGGMTICGVAALEEAGARSAMIKAVEASAQRGQELGE